ncbi:hypothetical protein [Absidia glauca]|uniref:Uncharacterized protein n=1 Tax=Absidia glauca TaxID=4829 RepID=A0A163K8N5_ABSGL|nr:hypothetical protein [Absidia glauca]
MTNAASNNKVSPLKARKTLPATHRSRKKPSTHHDISHPSAGLKTPPPSPSNLSDAAHEKRLPKLKIKSTLPENPSSHQPHRHRHHPRLKKDRRSSTSLSSSSSATRIQPSKHHHHHHRHHHPHQRFPSAHLTKRHRFDKDTLDTFCFHWPAMHCYVLVRILPRSIAILPIRTRLAFLYFCHAPRPHHPTAPPRHPHRIQSMGADDLLRTLEHQNLALQQLVDRLVTEVEQWRAQVIGLETDDAALEEKMDGLWAALERHKAEHPLEDDSLATVRDELGSHMAATHQRISQGSVAWEQDAFERLHRFQFAKTQNRSVPWPALLVCLALVIYTAFF